MFHLFIYVLPFQLFSFATLLNNNLKHLAQEGTTATHTPWGCHPTPPDSQLSCLRAFSLFKRDWCGGVGSRAQLAALAA